MGVRIGPPNSSVPTVRGVGGSRSVVACTPPFTPGPLGPYDLRAASDPDRLFTRVARPRGFVCKLHGAAAESERRAARVHVQSPPTLQGQGCRAQGMAGCEACAMSGVGSDGSAPTGSEAQ